MSRSSAVAVWMILFLVSFGVAQESAPVGERALTLERAVEMAIVEFQRRDAVRTVAYSRLPPGQSHLRVLL